MTLDKGYVLEHISGRFIDLVGLFYNGECDGRYEF